MTFLNENEQKPSPQQFCFPGKPAAVKYRRGRLPKVPSVTIETRELGLSVKFIGARMHVTFVDRQDLADFVVRSDMTDDEARQLATTHVTDHGHDKSFVAQLTAEIQIAIAKASQDELKLLEEAARKMNDCFNDLASQVMEVREETSAGLVLLLGVQAACPHFTTRVKKRGYII